MRITILALCAVIIAACGDKPITPEQHSRAVKYQQEALCACLSTKTWLGECMVRVTILDRENPEYFVTDSERLHAPCIVNNHPPK